MSHTIVHFEIPADDPEKLAEFYRGLFGWEIAPMAGDIEYWSIQTVPVDENGRPKEPGVNGGMMRRMVPQQTPINYISVENVDEAAAKAQSLGATVTFGKMEVPGVGWWVALVDPQGNPFAIFQPMSM